MVSTKHCCWGRCNSDSRYPDKLAKSLKEMDKSGQKIYIPFFKPSQNLERCQRYINACSRENFTTKSITRNSYICALHWPGEKGQTEEYPDPLKANFNTKLIKKACRAKRKAPKQREPESRPKKSKIDSEEEVDLSSAVESCLEVE